jgi:hypothetical protein
MVDFELIDLRINLSEATVAFMEKLIRNGESKASAEEVTINIVKDAFNHISESGEKLT